MTGLSKICKTAKSTYIDRLEENDRWYGFLFGLD